MLIPEPTLELQSSRIRGLKNLDHQHSVAGLSVPLLFDACFGKADAHIRSIEIGDGPPSIPTLQEATSPERAKLQHRWMVAADRKQRLNRRSA